MILWIDETFYICCLACDSLTGVCECFCVATVHTFPSGKFLCMVGWVWDPFGVFYIPLNILYIAYIYDFTD